ncbi:MAG: adenylate/guanylate cyclase domain-containing protein [Candidatus Brocadiia bacterium]|jgi:class 3 adenylate cyclase|nr:adenylate/guanylate cyclase domain-containing protein [Candidatus Brocadiia bacterium]
MVSTEGHAATQRLEVVSKISAFLGASESDVNELLVQGRLERALLAALRSRGTSITPTVKNSVQSTVRSLEYEPVASNRTSAQDFQSTSGATATIMFTDIVGSTSIMERLGDRAGREALAMHDEIVRHEVTAYEGVEVKALGDGFMLTFRSVGRGLACAAAIQKDFALYSRRQPAARISVRIGLNVGEPVESKEDIFGMSVIIASRISALAQGGQVLVSQVAYALASSSGDFRFRPIGKVELKGVEGRHDVYEMLWEEP